MDPGTKRRIEETVLDVLRTADIDTVTELKVREAATASLGIDLSHHISCKKLVREVVEAFLLSTPRRNDDGKEDEGGSERRNWEDSNRNKSPLEKDERGERLVDEANRGEGDGIRTRESRDGEYRSVSEPSSNRIVTPTDSGREDAILIEDFCWKDGKLVPGSKGNSLTSEQCPELKKSLPAMEEAKKNVQSRTRSPHVQNQIKINNGKPAPDENKRRKLDKPSSPEISQKEVGNRSASCSSHPQQQQLHPVDIIRFDGNNYHDWAERMELFLKKLNIAYVLSSPCPSASTEVIPELPLTTYSAQKWIDDDYICRINILNTLSDPLFLQYSKKTGCAKDLWEDLKFLYISNKHGTKVSLVKMYMEFKMIEGKSVIEQVQELNSIAEALVPQGMYVEENFHVNVIISKLPPSWKDLGIMLMKEIHLPFRKLMDKIIIEEENRRKGEKGEYPPILDDFADFQKARKGHTYSSGFFQENRDIERERRGVLSCTICKKKGHLAHRCWFRHSGNMDVRVDKVNGSGISKYGPAEK